MHPFLERAVLAMLRRVAPRASRSFAVNALYIAAAPQIRRTLLALAEGETCDVRSGPFAGMAMLRDSPGTGHLAKNLGTYETQLAPWIEAAIAKRPARVVNVGCGDGYYLSGDRITVESFCTPERLDELCGADAFSSSIAKAARTSCSTPRPRHA